MTEMQPMPFDIGQKILVLEGPWKHRIGQVTGRYDGYPREWAKVTIDGEDLMFDWHEIRKVSEDG